MNALTPSQFLAIVHPDRMQGVGIKYEPTQECRLVLAILYAAEQARCEKQLHSHKITNNS